MRGDPLVSEILSQSDRVAAKFEQAAITPKRNDRAVIDYRPIRTFYIAVKFCHRYDLSPSYIVTELT